MHPPYQIIEIAHSCQPLTKLPPILHRSYAADLLAANYPADVLASRRYGFNYYPDWPEYCSGELKPLRAFVASPPASFYLATNSFKTMSRAFSRIG